MPPGPWPPPGVRNETLRERFGVCTERHGTRLDLLDRNISAAAVNSMRRTLVFPAQILKTRRALATATGSVRLLLATCAGAPVHMLPLSNDLRADLASVEVVLRDIVARLPAGERPAGSDRRGAGRRPAWPSELVWALRKTDRLAGRPCNRCVAMILTGYCGRPAGGGRWDAENEACSRRTKRFASS